LSPPHKCTLFPYTTLFRSVKRLQDVNDKTIEEFISFRLHLAGCRSANQIIALQKVTYNWNPGTDSQGGSYACSCSVQPYLDSKEDRKSTRLNSSHLGISYA